MLLLIILFSPFDDVFKLWDHFISFGNPIYWAIIIVVFVFAAIYFAFKRRILPFEIRNHNERKTYKDNIDDEINSMLSTAPNPILRFNKYGLLKHFNKAAVDFFTDIKLEEYMKSITDLFPEISEDRYKKTLLSSNPYYFKIINNNQHYAGQLKSSDEYEFALVHLNNVTSEYFYEQEYKIIHADIMQIRAHLLDRLESEKRRIASELHDSVGQVFSAAKLHISRLEDIQDDSRVQDVYKKSLDLIGSGISELKDITYRLRPKILEEMGLVAALKALVEKMDTKGVLTGTFDAFGDFYDLEESLEIAIYRIAQEGISNILKHSRASTFSIQLLYNQGEIRLLINDNGCGFNVEEVMQNKKRKKNMGLTNILERVKLFNGFCEFDNYRDKGTYLTIVIPIENNEWIPEKQ